MHTITVTTDSSLFQSVSPAVTYISVRLLCFSPALIFSPCIIFIWSSDEPKKNRNWPMITIPLSILDLITIGLNIHLTKAETQKSGTLRHATDRLSIHHSHIIYSTSLPGQEPACDYHPYSHSNKKIQKKSSRLRRESRGRRFYPCGPRDFSVLFHRVRSVKSMKRHQAVGLASRGSSQSIGRGRISGRAEHAQRARKGLGVRKWPPTRRR